MTVLLPLLLALGAAPATALAGRLRPAWAAPTGAAFAGLAFAATLGGWTAGGGSVELPWAPTWGLQLAFALDGLSALYALLATGIGFLVVVYAAGYLPPHLAHRHHAEAEQTRFFALLLLFMGAMVGLVMAQDLVLLFVFWDLTAVASYFLIGFDREEREARSAAFMALLVTGVTSVFFLVGALLLFAGYQTFSLPELAERLPRGAGAMLFGPEPAVALVALAALAKSAQVPFHFWLPRAMAAPTPVSAYLHSAALVAAGVFLIERVHPLVRTSDLVLGLLLAIGLVSMAVGGVLALTRDVLKRLLAYSTIAQYGYVVTMLGLGGPAGLLGASFYVLAHALAKSALFLTAGAVTQATGEERLTPLGGLWRPMPGLALASGVAAAGLAGLPLTVGFFKDELFFAAALERGWPFAGVAVLGAALTLAYVWRFWSGIFLGPLCCEPQPVSLLLLAPVGVLALVVAGGGVLVGPFARLAESAAAVGLGAPAPADLAYHLDARPENLLAAAAYLLGLLVVVARPWWHRGATVLAWLGHRLGPERWYDLALRGLVRLSDQLHAVEVRDLRGRLATVLVPTAVLVAVGLIVTPLRDAYAPGPISLADLPLVLALLLTTVAALLTTSARDHLTLALAVSAVGYSLAGAYAAFGAPDVALVAVLLETMFTLLLLGVLALFPRALLRRQARVRVRPTRRWRNRLVAIAASAVAFAVTSATLSQPAPLASVARQHVALAPAAHARDVVTAILADFRGLDTLGEITVVAIALVGVATLLREGRLQWPRS